MAVNPKSKYEASHTLAELQGYMSGMETRLRKIFKVDARELGGSQGKKTIAEHDRLTKREKKPILVAFKDGEQPAAPDGKTLDFTGTAWVEGQETQIAVFR